MAEEQRRRVGQSGYIRAYQDLSWIRNSLPGTRKVNKYDGYAISYLSQTPRELPDRTREDGNSSMQVSNPAPRIPKEELMIELEVGIEKADTNKNCFND